jgi:tetratricopeptide (TPR) repeat protein
MRILLPLLLGFGVCVSTFAQDRRATYLITGMVTLEDGKAVTEPVEVLLTCSGAVLLTIFTQGDGQFAFSLSESKEAGTQLHETAGSPSGGGFRDFNQMGRGLGDTGAYGSGRTRMSRINLNDCEISAALPGFLSEIIYPGSVGSLENPDVGTIVLHRLGDRSGTTVSLNTLKAPAGARKEYERALREWRKEKVNHRRVMSELRKAVSTYPEFSAAWHLLGLAQVAAGDNREEAMRSFRRAISSEAGYLPPYLELAELFLRESRPAEAAQWAVRAVELAPDLPRAAYLYAYSLFSLARFDEAAKFARRVLDSSEAVAYPGVRLVLGTVHANRGEYRDAAEEFRAFLRLNPRFEGAEELLREIHRWEATGLISAELGAGPQQ